MKKAFIKSYGCQMNAYDSGRMADLATREGYGEADGPEGADLIILNTCHIREKAAEKVYSELGRLNVIKRERASLGRDLKVVVAGCVAQAEGAEIIRRAPVVDAVVGPGSYHRLPDLIRSGTGGAVEADFAQVEKFRTLPRPDANRIRRRGVSAFLTVQEGCDKFCSFCVVPYTRGAELSRPVAAILDEARALLDAGVRELTVIGQNVNAFHGEGPDGRPWTLARLLEALAALPGVLRLRYTTSHPLDMADDLIAAHADLPTLMPYLHLPVQAGSDRVLAAMNRRHRVDDYRRVVDRVRQARPDIALSSDFIVGFPGETDADFADTMRLAAAIGFAASFSFKYSPRPGTPAADRPDPVSDATASARLQDLQGQLERDRQAFNRATVGQTLDVLIERPGRHPGQLNGKTPYLQQVQVTGVEAAPGAIVPARVTGTAPNSLFAEAIVREGDVPQRSLLVSAA